MSQQIIDWAAYRYQFQNRRLQVEMIRSIESNKIQPPNLFQLNEFRNIDEIAFPEYPYFFIIFAALNLYFSQSMVIKKFQVNPCSTFLARIV